MNATGMSHAIVRLPRTGRFGRRLGPLWGPVRRAGYQLVGVMMVALFPALGCAQAPAESQQPVRRVPGMEVELKITDRFDANDDGWLNADERAAAREYLATEGTARRGPGGAR